MSFTITEATIVSGTLFACRRVFGYIFSNEKEVVDYVTVMAPLICISVILDSIQGVLAGVARGCGWQHIGVYVNLVAYYLCGIPVAASLAFLEKMRGKGLWIGVQVGAFVQCVLLSIITSCINWEQQAIKARKRLFDSEFPADNRLMGMASGLETICGQAYGGQQYQRIGIQTYTAIFSLILVSIPVSLLWINMETILVFIGQDPLISHEAGKFTIWLVPALFAYAILQPLVRYFQIQSLLLPMFASSCVTLIIHVPLCWALVFKTSLSNVGGALAVSISIWSNVIFLVLYMRYSSACAKTRAPISMELFKGMWEFFRFAIPSAVMVCLEWWSYELLVLLSGLLPNPQLETSVLSVCLNTIATLYTIPFGIGAAASTRVSNELGAGNSHAARVAVLAAMSLAVIETSIVSATLFACRNVFGYIFSNEKEVVDYVTAMAPLVCISVILDSIQGVLTGIARGCGWQHLGVYVNLGAFYLCGIPMAALLAFLVRLGGKGLWIGIQSGAFVQCILLSIITGCINWEKQAIKARKRLFDEKISADNILV
ncbi:protein DETOXIFICATION 12-like isoform X1 [Glycine soja]|uniref:protein DETOXIFICATION 12-like isoform X1 n=1 Tax=Glycine soja TaxID=3848 RepID=UPI00103AE929|nr:protein DETOXIFICATION 12-like isoform X1 [Glycine soja]XP_028182250.1 protein DETOXIFICATION 12-like isoform X1 [Glycine soja]